MSEEQVNEYLTWLGYADKDIEHWKLMSWFLPGPMDLVNWQAKEVFEPEMIERYGLDDEFEGLKHEDFRKVGVTEEQEKNFWRAHWQHASWMQVVEMLHRGLLTADGKLTESPTTPDAWAERDEKGREAMYEWFRLVEIPPFWRDLLNASSWNIPTRVDVRRWWDMRTIDEAELYSIYHRQGYHGKDLENYVMWTKVYTAFPDLMVRWKNGWINEADVRSELANLGMPEERIEEMIQTKIKAAKPERTAKERDLTKTDIIKGLKREVISREQTIELLMDLGYDEDEADYLIDIELIVAAGSPESYQEFKQITQKYRVATGREVTLMPEELKKIAAELVQATKDIESLKESIAEEEKQLIDEEILPEAATEKRDELRITLHRAEAELDRIQTEYDRLLAQWRHGE
jgi:hypothetical protein